MQGKPSLEKCAAIKKKRDLQKEVEGLDTSLIIENEGGRRSRGRSVTANRPSYVVDKDTSEEEVESEDDDENDEGENENESSDVSEQEEATKKKQVKKTKVESDDDAVEEPEEEETSADEYEVI
jgi:hypothetical protein